MTERYISETDDEYVYFLDTKSENYKTLEDFEKTEFENAKRDNIDIEEYEDAILQSANDKYWNYIYENHIEADVVMDKLNKQDMMINVLREELELADKQNTSLEKENDKLKKALWESETAYIEETNEFSIDVEKDMEFLKKEFEREYLND